MCTYPPAPAAAKISQMPFFSKVRDTLAELEIEPSWSFKYNAGANPIAFAISKQQVTHSKIIEILKEAYELA